MSRKIYPFNQAIADHVLERMGEGHMLTEILVDNVVDGRISLSAWRRWVRDNPELAAAYQVARAQQIETWSDDILKIADDSSADWVEDEYGRMLPNHEHINRSRLRIDTRKWLMSKLLPKRYGDHQQVNQQVGGQVKVVIERGADGAVNGRHGPTVIDLKPNEKGPALGRARIAKSDD